MGLTQSQELQQYISSYVDTSAVSQVISSYATRTNAIVTNAQDMDVVIEAGTISGPINLEQEIESVIDVQQMVDRSDTNRLVNDLQTSLTQSLDGALSRMTEGLDILSKPTNQDLVQRVSNDIHTSIQNTINTQTLDEILLSASNIQKGRLHISANTIAGPITFSQRIQANIMAQNLVKQVVSNLVQNKDIKDLSTILNGHVEIVEKSPISSLLNLSKWIKIIGGVLLLLVGILLVLLLPLGLIFKTIIGVILGIMGIGLILWGIHA